MIAILLLVGLLLCVVGTYCLRDDNTGITIFPIFGAFFILIFLVFGPVRYVATYNEVALTKFKTDRSVTIYIDSLPHQERVIERTYIDALTYETFDSITNATVEVSGNIFKYLPVFSVKLNINNSKNE